MTGKICIFLVFKKYASFIKKHTSIHNGMWEFVQALHPDIEEKLSLSVYLTSFTHSVCVCGDRSDDWSYLHFIIWETDDTQSFPHQLPFIAVVDGAHFGTVTLKSAHTETYAHSAKQRKQGGGLLLTSSIKHQGSELGNTRFKRFLHICLQVHIKSGFPTSLTSMQCAEGNYKLYFSHYETKTDPINVFNVVSVLVVHNAPLHIITVITALLSVLFLYYSYIKN